MSCDPAIPLLGIHYKEFKTGSQKNICTPLFIAALFTKAKIWNNFPGGSVVKYPPTKARDLGSIPELGRSPGGDGNPLQYSCLGNSMDRGAWWAPVCGISESWT